MKEFHLSSTEELQSEMTHWVRSNSRPGDALLLPAGRSLLSVYAYWESEKPGFLETLRLVQVDELETEDRFAEFFRTHLPSYPVQSPETFVGNPDLALLGLGLNGHVGFHEPNQSPDFDRGTVQLSPSSTDQLGLSQDARAWTFGVGTFLKCRALALVAIGQGKEMALQGVRDGDPSIPASYLQANPEFFLYDATAIKQE